MGFKISQLMAISALLGVNIGWIRAFLITEQQRRSDLFDHVFLIFFALQFGLCFYLRTKGRHRRFWLGFMVSGLAATVALIYLFRSDLDLLNSYSGAASELAYYILPRRIDVALSTNHWDCFLAIIFFLPSLLSAFIGGLLAAALPTRPGEVRSVPTVEPAH